MSISGEFPTMLVSYIEASKPTIIQSLFRQSVSHNPFWRVKETDAKQQKGEKYDGLGRNHDAAA